MPEITFQPKQSEVHELVYHGEASWIGLPGGRGGAKSGCLQRVMLDRRANLPGTIGVIVMRNYEQVMKYHVNVMLRDYPDLNRFYSSTDYRLVLPMGRAEDGSERAASEIQFSWAPALKDVIRRFRSGSFYDIFVDQAEQFTEAELREMKQSCRWKGAPIGACKFALAFNMGGAGIDFLRKKFHLKEMNPNERPSDFEYVHFHPWDNVQWVISALEADGLTDEDYYSWPEDVRKQYCAERSDYGRNLVAQDAPLVKRDWDGSWDALEGTYFGRVWDRDTVVLERERIVALVKPWWTRWMSQDWGKGHFCPTLWHARGEVSPEEAKAVLGWKIKQPLKVTVTYREYIAGGAGASDEGADRELAEKDIAREMVERTPGEERPYIRQFFLSPDAFELSVRRQGQSQIAQIVGAIVREAGLPYPIKADNQRKDGWTVMYNALLATKRHGANAASVPKGSEQDEAWLISADCPQLVNAIPLLPRDPKDLDDVLKTDKAVAKIEQDMGDCARYGLKSMLRPGRKPETEKLAEKLAALPTGNMTARHMTTIKHEAQVKRQSQPVTRVRDWRSRLEDQ